MKLKTMNNIEIQASPEVIGDVAPSMTTEETSAQCKNWVKELVDAAEKLDQVFRRMPSEVQDNPTVHTGLRYFYVIKEALRGFASFVESPLGQATTAVVWKHMKEVENFVEIAAPLVAATFFLVIGQGLLDANEDDLRSNRESIESSITFVRGKLEQIEARVNEAANKLMIIGRKDYKSPEEFESLLFEFGENVRQAKLDIDECETELNDVSEKVESVINMIEARLIINGVFRGAVVAGGALAVYILIKKHGLNPYAGIALGFGVATIALSTKLPRSRKLHTDFLRFRETQRKLYLTLQRMKKRLESHETRYRSEVMPTNHPN